MDKVTIRIEPLHPAVRRSVLICLVSGVALCALFAPSVSAGEPMSVCEAVWELRFEKALEMANEIVAAEGSTTGDKVDAYRCEAYAYVSQRQLVPAKGSIGSMLGLDSSARFSPDYGYPPALISLYHAVRDSLFPGTTDIRTIAVGDFEDNSVYSGKFKNYDFSLFGRALVHTIGADLAEATDLKIVDRQRIDQILGELKLGQSGFADPREAVRAGQLLGAQTFIFGQYMILSKDTVRIDARVVHTATGEIILTKQVTGEFGGDPLKFLELEKSLVLALAEGIDQILGDEGVENQVHDRANEYYTRKREAMARSTEYVESKFLVAEALELEDVGDYESAQKTWKKVLLADPENETAPLRLRVLHTILQS